MAGELAAGTVLDGTYVLQDAIGGGRSGRVYRAVHLALQRPVAVKVLHGGDDTPAEAFARFRVEAEALGRLAHPHVVAVTDFGIDPRDGGVPYLVMDLVDGRALRAALATDEAADLEVAASWLRQLADALAYAHARGVVHGDVSADNVLISSDGPVRRVTLLDFGLAWLVEAASEAAERVPEPGLFTPVATTLDYCAPERLRGEAPSAAGDVYALAVLAYRILTGRFPFGGEPKALRHAHLTADPPPASSRVPDLPPALDALLADGLAKRPDARPTAAEFAVRIGDAARTLARARWRRREFPRRLAVASALAAAAMATAATLAPTEPLRRAEGVSEDVRFAAAAGRPADPRLLLVAIDDRALAADPRPLSLRADEFAAGVSRAFAAGADGVAIDLLLPATWASSETFGTLLLEHGDRLVVGMTSDGATVVGPEAVDPLVAQALGAERANRLFGLVATPVGPDGVVRRARAVVADVTGAPRALLAGQLAALGRGVDVLPAEPVVVDYRTPAAAIERMDWTTFVTSLAGGTRLQGRLVVVGAEYTGAGDRHRAPQPGGLSGAISGLALQGLLTGTWLDEQPIVEAPRGPTWLTAAILAGLVAFGVLWLTRVGAIAVAAGGVLVWAGGAMALFAVGHLVQVAAPLLGLVVAIAMAGAVRLRLPQRPE